MLMGNSRNEWFVGDEEFVCVNRLCFKDIDFYYDDNNVWDGMDGFDFVCFIFSWFWLIGIWCLLRMIGILGIKDFLIV